MPSFFFSDRYCVFAFFFRFFASLLRFRVNVISESGGIGTRGNEEVRRDFSRGSARVGHLRGGGGRGQLHRHTGHPRRGLRREPYCLTLHIFQIRQL